MTVQQYYTRILLMLLISALVSSCNDPDQPAVTDLPPVIETTSPVEQKDSIVDKETSVDEKTAIKENTGTQNKYQIALKKPTTVTPSPALKLSIEDIEVTLKPGNASTAFDRYIDIDSDHMAQILTGMKKDDGIKLSGKLFTDQEMIDAGEYLHAVEGVQLNIEGKFK